MPLNVTDLYSRKGSRLLAEVIANHWLDRGHIVLVENYEIPETGFWGVRSNLVNGLPRSRPESESTNLGWYNRLSRQLEETTC